MAASKSSKKPHWYKLYYGECPVCGRDRSHRVRVYGKKPKSVLDRIAYLTPTQTYCGCSY